MLEEAHIDVQSDERVLLWQTTACDVAEAVDWLGRLCAALDMEGEDVTLRMCLTGMQGRVLAVTEGYATVKYRCTEPDVHWETTKSVEEWCADRVDLAAEIVRELLMRSGWPDPPRAVLAREVAGLYALHEH